MSAPKLPHLPSVEVVVCDGLPPNTGLIYTTSPDAWRQMHAHPAVRALCADLARAWLAEQGAKNRDAEAV